MKVSTIVMSLFLFFSSYGQSIDSSNKALYFLDQGWKLYKNYKFEECLPYLDSSILYDSTKTLAFSLKYESLWFLKRFAESAETFERSMTLDTNILFVHAYVILGMLYDQANMRKRAKEQYLKAIEIFENGYVSPIKGDKSHEIEYLFAFGLLGDKRKWKYKLEEFIKKYPDSNFQRLRRMSRKELLIDHFSPYAKF